MTFASYYDLSKLNLFLLDDNEFMRKVIETMCDALSAKELYRRLVWIIDNPTPFIRTATYFQPDRRHENLGPPPGMRERRKDHLIKKG